jgi:hypothetical protein
MRTLGVFVAHGNFLKYTESLGVYPLGGATKKLEVL